jgi:chitinase
MKANLSQSVLITGMVFLNGLLLLFPAGGCQQVVPVQNLAPLVYAGKDQTTVGGQLVVLDGSGSLNQFGGTLQYEWVQTAGTPVTLTGANKVLAGFTAPETTQVMTFQLTATNQFNASASDSVNIVVNVP